MDTDASVPLSSRSKGRYSRGKSRPSAPHVVASAPARSASSSAISTARSRMRRGSTSSTLAPSGSKSTSTCSSAVSHGSHDSIPSKVRPSARRSQDSLPHLSVSANDEARWRTSGEGNSSLQPKIRTSSRSAIERWSATENWVSLSTSSPQRSTRTGETAVDGKTSRIEPRTAISPRCSTWYSRR